MSAMVTGLQNTLAAPVSVAGVGVHSGLPVSVTLRPAAPDAGIVFRRVDLPEAGRADIPALVSAVGATDLCTVLGDASSGNYVMTVEHLMAALQGLRLDNVIVEIDSAEVPVLDGSSAEWVAAIDAAGLIVQARPRRYLRVLREVRFDMGPCWGTFAPAPATSYDVTIDFEEEVIGRQSFSCDLTPATFRRDVSRARTFGFFKDVERYRAAGYALGSSLENSVVIAEDDSIMTPGGLRHHDEFVRHKLLDAVGDLALAGAPILGRFTSYRGGHKVNALSLAALLADPTAYEWTTLRAEQKRRPAMASGSLHAGMQGAGGRIAAAAYAPDRS